MQNYTLTQNSCILLPQTEYHPAHRRSISSEGIFPPSGQPRDRPYIQLDLQNTLPSETISCCKTYPSITGQHIRTSFPLNRMVQKRCSVAKTKRKPPPDNREISLGRLLPFASASVAPRSSILVLSELESTVEPYYQLIRITPDTFEDSVPFSASNPP